jgi:flagellar motor protein MotB
MYRRRHGTDGGVDLWPVIADSIIGILAVYVFLNNSHPVDENKEKYKEELRQQLAVEQANKLIDAFTIDSAEACIVYSADALSFDSCNWDIPDSNAERIREHMRWFGKERKFIKRIQIEGHADSRAADGCSGVEPFRDNLQLSQNRARAIYNILLGMAPTDRLGLAHVIRDDSTIVSPDGLDFVRELNRRGKLQTAGFGDTRPRDAANQLSARNRRVEIRIVFEEDSTDGVATVQAGVGSYGGR